MRLLVLVSMIVGGGCGEEFECSKEPVTPACNGSLDHGDCMDEGGCWIRYYAGPGCQCPTTDSGEVCETEDDCESVCLIDHAPEGDLWTCADALEGRCAGRRPMIGCFCYLDDTRTPSKTI